MPNNLTITVHGLDRVQAALNRFPGEIARHFEAASTEAAEEVLNTTGLREYPAATAANAPPTPYYQRGRGTQYASRNDGRSERLGTRFYVQATTYRAEIGNTASYAEHVVGEKQAARMAGIGWKRLIDVAQDKQGEIGRIFQGWIDRLIEKVGL